MKCPCGSGEPFSSCCNPFILGERTPNTAEQLMRSRYTAYTQAATAYLIETTCPTQRKHIQQENLEHSCKDTDWISLEVLETQKGTATDQTGTVTFIAKARDKKTGFVQTIHECSSFEKKDGAWVYTTGFTPKATKEEKSGRNAPCPCGSGKKYKQCCL